MKKDLRDIFKNVPEVDERSVQFLVKALESNNLDGFDYLEFKQNLGAIAAQGLDEVTSYKTTYTFAANMGLTKESLIKTARYYLKILEREYAQFDEAVKQQVQRQVATKKKQSDNLMQQINNKHRQIEQLKTQISQHQAEIVKLQEEMETAQEKIDGTKVSFEKTYAIIEQEIKNDIERIETYLID